MPRQALSHSARPEGPTSAGVVSSRRKDSKRGVRKEKRLGATRDGEAGCAEAWDKQEAKADTASHVTTPFIVDDEYSKKD